jgi:hypothetical protein
MNRQEAKDAKRQSLSLAFLAPWRFNSSVEPG